MQDIYEPEAYICPCIIYLRCFYLSPLERWKETKSGHKNGNPRIEMPKKVSMAPCVINLV